MISISQEPILAFGLLLLLILLVPLLFQQLKLPGIVGLLIAGSVVGQNGLGVLETGGVIDVLGKVGLLYLMFLAGLEISLDQIKRDRRGIAVFGTLTFLIPQISGTLIFLSLGYSWPASILIASMLSSHTLVAYPIITRMGLTKEKSVSTTVGGTIITDTVALLVLAVVARYTEGELGWEFWITFVTLFCLYLGFMFAVLPRISFSFFRKIGDRGRFTYVYVIGTMLLCAWLAEEIGIEAIVGAFFAGLALNRLLSNKGPLKNRVEFFGDAFFIPIFLVYVGMLVDFRVMLSGLDVWMVMATMCAIVVGAKWLAAFASARLLGFDRNQAWVMFGLSNTQAAATLAAVFVGLELEIFGSEVLNGAIMTILLTCIIGPIVIDKYGQRLTEASSGNLDAPTAGSQRILVPLSNPSTSAHLIELASNLRMQEKVSIYPLAVLNTINDFRSRQEKAQKLLDLTTGQIHAISGEAVPVMETNLNVAEGISLAVVKHAITDVVIGWNGVVSAATRIFGSVLDQMLNTTPQHVYVCKLEQPVSTFRTLKIVLSPKTVYGPTFRPLFGSILALAENLNSAVEILHLKDERAPLDRHIAQLPAPAGVKFREFETFELLLGTVGEEITDTELLVVTNQRTGDYGWTYGVNLIPRMMAEKKPQASFVVAYPQNPDTDEYKTDLLYMN